MSPNVVTQCPDCGITFDKDGTLADDYVCPNVDGSELNMSLSGRRMVYGAASNKQIPNATVAFLFVLFDG